MELGDSEELMQRVLVPIKSGSERTLQNSVIEGNVETTENTENAESSECTFKMELDDAEALISHLFVPTEFEPDFQGTSEDPVMEENLEATQNTQDMVSGEFEMKIDVTNTEASMASSFAPTRAESDLEKAPGENEEDSQASKMTEVCISQASFLVKEEPIDYEETWQDHIKLEPTSPLSINIKSDGSDKSSEDGVNVKFDDTVKEESEELSSPCSIKEEKHDISEENYWLPHLNYSPLHCSSQLASSNQSLSAMDGMDTQKKFGGCSYSSSSKTAQLPSFGCQNVLSVASCSKDAHTANQEKAPNVCLCNKHPEQQVAAGTQKQQSGHSGVSSSTNLEETHFQRGTQQFGSMPSSTGEEFLKCDLCGKEFQRKSTLVRHMLIHNGERPFKCSQCGKSFTRNSHLSHHMRKHNGDRPYRCSQCGKSFREKSNLSKHIRIHSGDQPFICSQCGESFIQKEYLTVHIRKHTGNRPYKCSECGESFTVSGNLTKHMRTHSGDRPYKCSQCGKSFTQRGSLTRHMRTHSGDRPYKCSHCEKFFTQNSSLTSHIRTHSGDRPYKCSQCGKSFTESSKLTIHMRTHSGNRPYKCSECGKAFVQSSHLSSHMRTHTGNRPYKCSECGKAFVQSNHLTSHMRTHAGDWPYKCSQCGASFTESSKLTEHMREHTGD